MAESKRDRVARVLATADGYDWVKIPPRALYRTETLRRADALIADGLVYGVGLDRDRAEFFKRQRDQAWRRIRIMGWALAGTTALSIIGIVQLVTS